MTALEHTPETRPADLVDFDAERSVLGSMLIEPPVVPLVASLQPADFALPKHEVIFRAIVASHADTGASDPLAVRARLERDGDLETIGGLTYLLDLAESVLCGRIVEVHAALVREKAAQRRLRDIGLDVARRLADGEESIDVAAAAESQLRDVTASQSRATHSCVRDLEEIEGLPAIRWLVHNLLPSPSVGFLVGAPNCGKSTIAVDVAMRVFHGEDWIGRRVAPASVLYVAGEAPRGIGERATAWRRAHGACAPRDRYFAVATNVPPLSSPVGMAELQGIVADLAQQRGHAPGLVIIDTLSAHWAESEDKAEFAAPAMAALQQIAQQHGACFLLLHHERKPQPGQGGGAWAAMRGSGAWNGSADFVLQVASSAAGLEIITTKQRDAEKGAPVHCRLQAVELGVGPDGAPRSAVIVIPAAGADQSTEDEELERDLQRIVDGARRVVAENVAGERVTKTMVVAAAGIRKERGLSVFDLAVSRGRLLNTGTRTAPNWCPAARSSVPFLKEGEPGTGEQRVPGTGGNQGGTGNQSDRKDLS